MKNKVFVRFIITGFDYDPSKLTEKIVIAPTKTWVKDGLKVPTGTIKHKNNGWEFNVKKENVWDIEDVVSELFKGLYPKKKIIADLVDIEKKVSVVIYSKDDMPSISYSRETINFLSKIGATLEHDIYRLE